MKSQTYIIWAIERTYLSYEIETFRGPIIKYFSEQTKLSNCTDGWILSSFKPCDETPELLRALALWKLK